MTNGITRITAPGALALALSTLVALAAAPARADDEKTKAGYGKDTAEQARLEAAAQSPKKFVETVGAGGLLEVKLGRLATEKAESQQVKDFAKMMATDHSQANLKLEQMARGNGIEPPKMLPAEKQAKLDHLSALSGAAFDREYMKLMVEDHRRNVELFREAARSSALGGDLREFAAETLPKLQSHLEMAEKIAASVG
jgi:putative membrane protein